MLKSFDKIWDKFGPLKIYCGNSLYSPLNSFPYLKTTNKELNEFFKKGYWVEDIKTLNYDDDLGWLIDNNSITFEEGKNKLREKGAVIAEGNKLVFLLKNSKEKKWFITSSIQKFYYEENYFNGK